MTTDAPLTLADIDEALTHATRACKQSGYVDRLLDMRLVAQQVGSVGDHD